MRRGAALAVAVLALGLNASADASARTRATDRASRALNARVIGTFAMTARVTVAANVRGEHPGQVLVRDWKIVASRCAGSVCGLLRLDRERSDHRHDHLTLRRIATGRYAGLGVFYAALKCYGRVYGRGSRVPYRVTLTVEGVTTVEGIAFARRIAATYYNTARSDRTPCPLGPSHDAARYRGQASSPLPSPPTASFSVGINAVTDTASFRDTSRPGIDGARIVAREWDFGDPASGTLNGSTLPAPPHRFSAPGAYTVSLTVRDSNGLSSTSTSVVTAPGPPSAGFAFAVTPLTTTVTFSDQSQAGIGGAPIVSWSWQFGDPSSGVTNQSTLQNPSHAYSQPGTYQVTLTVTDVNGRSAAATEQVAVPPP